MLFYIILGIGATVIAFMAAYLGSKQKFYDKFAWWDRLIHFLSGILFVSFGVALSCGLMGLNRFHILLFSLALSISLHVVWEIGEYAIDSLFKTNNQRWQKRSSAILHTPATAIQPAGLVDTMNDTIVCVIGSLFACVVWLFVL